MSYASITIYLPAHLKIRTFLEAVALTWLSDLQRKAGAHDPLFYMGVSSDVLVRAHARTLCFVMATSSSSTKFPAKLSEATDAGDKFVKLFYETFDKRRQVSSVSLPGAWYTPIKALSCRF